MPEPPEPEGGPLDQVVDGLGGAVGGPGSVPGDELVSPPGEAAAKGADLGREVVVLEIGGELIEVATGELGVGRCVWYLDSPVSNSGRLRQMILDAANARGCDWQVEVVPNPDIILAAAQETVATADSVILDRCRQWLNLARVAVSTRLPDVQVVRLSAPAP